MMRTRVAGISSAHPLAGVCGRLRQRQGFTLLELVLATSISTLVIAILSVALTFSLRMWQRQQERQSSELPMLMELMALQLADFDATPLSTDVGTSQALFVGDSGSLAFATDHSVKALSGGVPVVARYIYEPKGKTLYYAEIPMDPYHAEHLRDFLDMKPGQKDLWPRFYPVEIDAFSIEYLAEEDGELTNLWDQQGKVPLGVLISWKIKDDNFTRWVIPNLPFSQTVEGTGGVMGSPTSSTGSEVGGSGSSNQGGKTPVGGSSSLLKGGS